MVFCLSLPFFGPVYIMYTFVCFFGAFNTIAFTYQKKNIYIYIVALLQNSLKSYAAGSLDITQ